MFLAKAEGSKADQLNSDAALKNLNTEDTVAFEVQVSRAARDWSVEPGKETACRLLSTFARTSTGVPALDDSETIWQLNWVQALMRCASALVQLTTWSSVSQR